ncbi:MAG: hypothetical protein Q9227_004463 [Pyrenula ochraceoflavens]
MPQYFPWESIAMRAAERNCEGRFMIPEQSSMSCAKGDAAFDLSHALCYGRTAGSPKLLDFVKEHIQLIHNPQYADWETCLTCGTSSAIEIMLRMLCNRGDSILAEAFTYPGFIEAAKPLGVSIVGVAMDDEGILPDDLAARLSLWDAKKGPRPTLLYMIPSGQNPTGTTQTLERRRAIYRVAEQYDLIIIEDDPYFLLQLQVNGSGLSSDEDILPEMFDYLRQLPMSYLALDTSGRVVRLDSTSKILAPGLRCGWLTASSQIVARYLAHTEFSTLSPSGPSQVMLYKLLAETWGHEDFLRWLIHLSTEYRRRRDTLVKSCSHHLPSKLCRWIVPQVGMFLWIKINLCQDNAEHTGCYTDCAVNDRADIEDKIYTRARESGVLVAKGSWFAVNGTMSRDLYFRLTFAAADERTFDEAARHFAEALQKEMRSP